MNRRTREIFAKVMAGGMPGAFLRPPDLDTADASQESEQPPRGLWSARREDAAVEQPQFDQEEADAKLLAGRLETAHLSNRWRVAIHEAGHGAVAANLKVKFNVLSVVPREDSLGRMLASGCRKSAPLHEAAVIFAGPAAEQHKFALDELPLRGTDEDIIHQILLDEFGGGLEDSLALALYEDSLRLAREQVRSLGGVIDRVARRLVVRQTLDAKTVRTLTEAYKGWT
jgi:hypothetical protein